MLRCITITAFSVLLGLFLYVQPCAAGVDVAPLDTETLKGNDSDFLIAREYKVPNNYLNLIGLKKPVQAKWLTESAVPFGPKPSVLFIESRRLLLVRATESGQKHAARHVREVWRTYRERLPKK